VSAYGLTNVSSNRRNFKQLTGAAYRNKLAGVAFSVGALSMVGFPLLCGFESKVLFAQAAVETHTKMFFTLFALAISTILNTVYFMKTVIRIYTPMDAEEEKENEFTHITAKEDIGKSIAMICLVVMNFALGIFSQPIIELIETGLAMFM
jgi:multicomponent Na+:H+ antiporter subunit D